MQKALKVGQVKESTGIPEAVRSDRGALRMLDPFKLFGRMFLALFKITGYLISCVVHVSWCVAQGKPEHAGDAFGDLGHGITDAIAEIFRD